MGIVTDRWARYPQGERRSKDMTQIDLTILDWIQGQLRCGLLDEVMPWLTMLGEAWAVILAAAVLLAIPKTRRLGLAVAIALVLDGVLCNGILKPLVARPRPYTLRTVELLIAAPKDFSFPSGHTAATFAVALALLRKKPRAGLPVVVLAAGVAFSRLYLYVHYPSDVLCGMLLGSLCGIAGAALEKRVKIPRQAGEN